tara:strand:+ start:10648 stop:13665 length:3018 start_codon:yes stop_codon:yes gene_type:complete
MNKYPLEQTANHLASQGRYGDSMLVHMNPKEVAGIASLLPEGQLTRNPQTGIFEAFSLGDVLPMVLPFIPGFGQLALPAKLAATAAVSTATGATPEQTAMRLATLGGSDMALGAAADAIPDAASGISPTDALASATDTLGQTQALNLQNLAALDPTDKIAAMNLQGLSGDALTNLSNIDPSLLQDPSFLTDLSKMNPDTFASLTSGTGASPEFMQTLTSYNPSDLTSLQNVGQSTLGNPQALAGIQNISPEGLESVIGSQSAVDMAQANVASAKDALYKPLSFKPSGAIADMSAGDRLSMVMENPGTVAKQFLKPSVFLPPAAALAHKEGVAIKDASNRAFREAEEEREAEYDEAKARMQGMYGYADPSYKARYLAASGGKVSLNKGGIADLVGPKKHYFYGGLGSLDIDFLGSLTPEQLAILREQAGKEEESGETGEDGPAEAEGFDVDPLTGVALPYYEEREEGYNPYFYANAYGYGPGSTYGASMIGRDRMPPDAYIQQNLRGRYAARPDRGYMAGFEPEFSYFQNVPFYAQDEEGNMFQNPDVFTPSRQYAPQRFNPIYGQPFFGSPVNTPSYLQNLLGYSSGISQVTPMNRFLPYAGYEPPPPIVQPRVRPTDDKDTPDDPVVTEDDTPDDPVVDPATTPKGGVGQAQGAIPASPKPKSYEDMVTFNPETKRFEAEYFDQDAGPYYFSEAVQGAGIGVSGIGNEVDAADLRETARQSVVNQLRAFSEKQAMKKYPADSPYWDNYASQFGYVNPHTGKKGANKEAEPKAKGQSQRTIPEHIRRAAERQAQQTGRPTRGGLSVSGPSGETAYFQEGGVGEITPENIKRGYDVAMTQPPAPQDGITAVLPSNQGEAEMLIEMTKKAILAEVPEEQVDAITEMYIAVFGEESYRRLRNKVLQDPLDEGIAAVQTEGLITGEGDGMSDSIDAHISGKQKAGLSNGEFVVPVDVLAHLGNGNSSVGTQKMYAMMDRSRQERQGNTEQAPAIDADQVIRNTLGPQYA